MNGTLAHPRIRGASLLLAALLAACGDGGNDAPKTPAANTGAASGVSIDGGGWSGVIYATDLPGRTSIKATITQTGDAVVITTSRPGGTHAHRFTGSITGAGKMRITDAFDGEVWSTYFGNATSAYIKLADFERPPKAGSTNDDFFVIELSRKGGTRPASVQATAPNTTGTPSTPAVPTPTTPATPTLPTVPTPPTPPTPPVTPTTP